MKPVLTAPVAAGALVAGYAAASVTGSRPLGGLVLLLAGSWCVRVWLRDHDRRMALSLAGVAFGAFVASHVLARVIGAWPAVLVAAAATGLVIWRWGDSRLTAA